MKSTGRMILWAWTILHTSAALPDITDGEFIEACVRTHNEARSSVSPPASDMLHMTWDKGLAITAKAWARHCVFEHNSYLKDVHRMHPTFLSVGENIWAGYPPSSFYESKAIENWVDEKQHYNYSSNICTNVCGHYTQVVWGSSYKVGCAAQLCPNGVQSTDFASKEGVIFVCNYATAGNVNRRQPYTYGAGCSRCEGTCERNLCFNQERDLQKSYNWTPDWDTTNPINYVTILVARPIALIFTFIAAYAVGHFYPNVFCYE
ncbi:GLIPR1-like protein 1 isoform 2-T3 [Spinachia spinachia]